jgi:hypothetical protein
VTCTSPPFDSEWVVRRPPGLNLGGRRFVWSCAVAGDALKGASALRELERASRLPGDTDRVATLQGAARDPRLVLQDRLAAIWSGMLFFLRTGDVATASKWSDELLILVHDSWDVHPGEDDEAQRQLWQSLAHIGGAMVATADASEGGDDKDDVEEHLQEAAVRLIGHEASEHDGLATTMQALHDLVCLEHCVSKGDTERALIVAQEAWTWVEPTVEAVRGGAFGGSEPALAVSCEAIDALSMVSLTSFWLTDLRLRSQQGVPAPFDGLRDSEDRPLSLGQVASLGVQSAQLLDALTTHQGVLCRDLLDRGRVDSLMSLTLSSTARFEHRAEKAVTSEGLFTTAIDRSLSATRGTRDKDVAMCSVHNLALEGCADLMDEWDRRGGDAAALRRRRLALASRVPLCSLAVDWGYGADLVRGQSGD